MSSDSAQRSELIERRARALEDVAERIVDFGEVAERIKLELRHSWLSSNRQESVAEHSWNMALMAILCYRHLSTPIDIEKTLKMILVHDLVEADAGDVPVTDESVSRVQKEVRERRAIDRFRDLLKTPAGDEVHALWIEFEERRSPESLFAKALDHIEVQMQHNLAKLATWEPVEYGLVYTKMDQSCAHDPFLIALCEKVKRDAEALWESEGVDCEEVRQLLAEEGSTKNLRAPVALRRGADTNAVDGPRRLAARRRALKPGRAQLQLFSDLVAEAAQA